MSVLRQPSIEMLHGAAGPRLRFGGRTLLHIYAQWKAQLKTSFIHFFTPNNISRPPATVSPRPHTSTITAPNQETKPRKLPSSMHSLHWTKTNKSPNKHTQADSRSGTHTPNKPHSTQTPKPCSHVITTCLSLLPQVRRCSTRCSSASTTPHLSTEAQTTSHLCSNSW